MVRSKFRSADRKHADLIENTGWSVFRVTKPTSSFISYKGDMLMEPLRCSRSARRAIIVSVVFCILVLFGLFFIRDLLISFFASRLELNVIIVGIGILGFIICFRELFRILNECRQLRRVSDSFGTDSVEGLKSELWDGDSQGLVRKRCLSVLAIGNNSGSLAEIATLLADLDAEYEESRSLLVRYFLGVMILLGLIGTFWGLLSTVSGVKEVLFALQPERIDDPVAFLNQFKLSISGMMGGLSTSFSTSLFGLGGSVLLGFVDVQTRQARSRLQADLDYFVIVSLLPATTQVASEETKEPIAETISGQRFENFVSNLVNRFDVLGHRTQDLLEETRKSRESSERTGKAIREIFESEDRLVNRILSIGLANLRMDSPTVLDVTAERQKQKEGS